MKTPVIAQAVVRLDRWFESMHGERGYGGPVVHWWDHCLQFTGAGLDWRYEGIVIGYLQLFTATGDRAWLAKARRAGDDLMAGQDGNGNFRNSDFEMNPGTAGMPHEAACDIALLRLSAALESEREAGGHHYLDAAERNLRCFYIDRVWRARGYFSDGAGEDAFVPNKAATLVEAFILLSQGMGDDGLIEDYVVLTLDRIVAHQATDERSPVAGGISQGSLGGRQTPKYFPFYVARCVPALLAGYGMTGHKRYHAAAKAACDFISRSRLPDGLFPQVVYADGSISEYPRWTAGLSEILRAFDLMNTHSFEYDAEAAFEHLLAGQLASGGFMTAVGFGSQLKQRRPPALDFRDVIPVVGWNDKAFRLLTARLPSDGSFSLPACGDEICSTEVPCLFEGEPAFYREDRQSIGLSIGRRTAYYWQKGSDWADIRDDRLLLR